jgi:hypothetical protein
MSGTLPITTYHLKQQQCCTSITLLHIMMATTTTTTTPSWEHRLKQAQEVNAAEEKNNIFIYTGGRAPRHVTHVIIDKSIKIIPFRAFYCCEDLRYVETHNGIRAIGKEAFRNCISLRRITVTNVTVIGEMAFSRCCALTTVEDSPRLDKIGVQAFLDCSSLSHINLPSVSVIEASAFAGCTNMTYANLGKHIEAIEGSAFYYCTSLRQLRFELGDNAISIASDVFDCCHQLTSVELVGNIHHAISSLGLEQWQTDMNEEIDRINDLLPSLHASQKTAELRQWIDSVQSKIECYKLMEYTSLLELALWKATILGSTVRERQQCRINCGAAIVIPNVMAFIKEAAYL